MQRNVQGCSEDICGQCHYGEAWDAHNLFVVDGSVLPTGLGVNPMITIEAVAHRIPRHGREADLKPCEQRKRMRIDGPCWSRTSDLGIKSPLLYQLS